MFFLKCWRESFTIFSNAILPSFTWLLHQVNEKTVIDKLK